MAAGLALTTLLTFSEVGSFGYVSYDDPRYVVNNYRVRSGLSIENLRWAFTNFSFANWHPLTWLSLMLDHQLFGEAPGAQHWVNAGLHIANALLLFAGLRMLTGALWRPALAAALFALHPLHVESVAWISARKDVLSTLLGLLSIGAYAAYARRRMERRPARRAYALCGALLALGLMAKPMLVTWPLVFLLLDYWPLGRPEFSTGVVRPRTNWWPLIAEKLPFFALALLSGVLTVLAQQRAGAVIGLEAVSPTARAANAALAYVNYLGMTVWPTGLVALYPHPKEYVSWLAAAGALALLVLATSVLTGVVRSRRYLAVGWLFYLATLVPVIGIVQVGVQAMADRYTYVPLIGIFVLVSWALADWVERRRQLRVAAATASAAALIALAWLSRQQVGHWRDTLSLFGHALAHTEANPIAQVHFASALQELGRFDEAAEHYRAALSFQPDDPYALTGLGNSLLRTGRSVEARHAFDAAIESGADLPEAFIGLGNYYMAQRDAASAYRAFHRAIELDPDSAEASNNAGAALASGGDVRAAIPHFEQALRLRPGYPDAARNLSAARAAVGVEPEAPR